MMKAAKNTWNFLKQLATLAHGCASETHLSMDVNMRRLPKESIIYMEILSVPCSLLCCICIWQTGPLSSAFVRWHLRVTSSFWLQPSF